MQSMQSITLGQIVVVSGKVPVNLRPPDIATAPRSRIVSLAEAQRSSGFTLLQPSVLPSPQWSLDHVEQLALPRPTGQVTRTTLVYVQGTTRWLALSQQPATGLKDIQVPLSIEAIAIGGQPAALMVRTMPGDPTAGLPNNQQSILHAFWERVSLFVELQAANVPREDLVRVGASLR